MVAEMAKTENQPKRKEIINVLKERGMVITIKTDGSRTTKRNI
jgi:hypothetical protein